MTTGKLKQRLFLELQNGPNRGKRFELQEGSNLIGRWDPQDGAFPEIDLDEDDVEAKISRRHAVVKFQEGTLTVEDVGSLNGTFLNKTQKVGKGKGEVLTLGDEILIGALFLKLIAE